MLRFLFLPLLGCVAAAEPVVTFAAERYDFGEDGTPVAERVTLVRDVADGDSTVTVAMPGAGTATPGVDYAANSIAVTFSGGELVKTIDIPITRDNLVELDETFELTLNAVANAAIGIGNTTTTVSILNDDAATISINDVAMVEGNGTGRSNFRFTVTLSNPVDIPIELAANVSSNDPGEVLVATWSRPFFPTDSPTSHTVWVSVGRDSMVELDEEFQVTLVGLDAHGRAVTVADHQGTGTILNDDQAIITLTGADVIEGDDGTPKIVVTATMDKQVDVPVTAAISASAVGATAGVDFRPRSETITVTTSGTPFGVEIIPDNLAEGTESILFTLQKRFVEASGRDVILRNNVNGFLHLYRILDDDFAPVANDDGPYEVIEDGRLAIGAKLGLLANDTDQDDGDARMTAALKLGPAHGTLWLDADGGFTYTPARDFSGVDSFTYATSDGTNLSPPKTVRINVVEQIDIAVGVDRLQSPLVAGGDARDVFRVSVTNHGPSNATDLRLHQNGLFPAGIRVTSATATAGSYDRGSWNLHLAENATATLTFTLRAEAGAPVGTGVIPFGFSFGAAGQADTTPGNNSAEASASVISAAATGTTITTAPKIERQSGLIVGQVTVSNGNSEPIPAFRLYIRSLPGDVQVYNASGTRAFGPSSAVLPFLLHNRPLAPSASVTLNVEFLRPSRDPDFTPEYEIELLPVPETEAASATAGIPVTRNQRLSNGDHLIEIASIPGAAYAVEYSHDMTAWTRVMPGVTAPANRLQWIDNGPPKTASHPTTVPARYYRFVLISSPSPILLSP